MYPVGYEEGGQEAGPWKIDGPLLQAWQAGPPLDDWKGTNRQVEVAAPISLELESKDRPHVPASTPVGAPLRFAASHPP